MKKKLNVFDARVQLAMQQRFGATDAMPNATVEEEDGILYVTPNAPDVRTGSNATTFAIADLAQREENGQQVLDMSFSSEYPVMRWGEREILSHDPEDCDVTRLAEVGSILRNHDPDQVVGVPTKVTLDVAGRKGRLTMRFGTTDCARNCMNEVLVDKTVRGVSVGYNVASWVFLKDETVSYKGRIQGPAWVAAKWSALEVSLTPIPADPSVGVNRNTAGEPVMNWKQRLAELEAKRTAGTALTDAERREMADLEAKRAAEGTTPPAPTAVVTPPAPEAGRTVTPPAATPAAGADPAVQERNRIREIQTRCQRFNLPQAFVDELISSGVSIEAAAQRMLDQLAGRSANGTAPGGSVAVVRDGRSSTFDAMCEGLMVRAGIMKREDAKLGSTFANYTLYEMARESLRQAGVSDSGDKREVAGRALRRDHAIGRSEIETVLARKEVISGSSSDFPLLLAAVAYKTLMGAYALAPIHYRKWCKVGSVSDFKDANRIEISEAGELLKINELGPYVATKFGEKQEKNRVYTYGRKFTMSRQGLINDDLGGFLTIPQAFGRKAKVLPQILALKKLMANPVLLQDDKALFSEGHGNLSAAAAYALDTLAHAEVGIRKAIARMRKQKAFTHAEEAATAEYLNLNPRVLLCNSDDAFVARQATRSAGALGSGLNVGVINPLADENLEVISEANLTQAGWGGSDTLYYLFADPNEAPVLEVVFLNGDDTPFMEEVDQIDVDGRAWHIRLDAGCEAIGYKGAQKEAGVG